MSEPLKYLTSTEVADALKINVKAARDIIRKLNQELEQQGYLTVPRKVPEKYLRKRFYG